MSPKNLSDKIFFVCSGEFWTIGFPGKTFSLADIKGLGYVQLLLRHPHMEFPSPDLLRGPTPSESQSAQLEQDALQSNLVIRHAAEDNGGEAIDPRARKEYQAKLLELNEELVELRRKGDYRSGEKVEAEIDFILKEIKRTQGVNRQIRKTGSASERARISVTHAIRLALDKISDREAKLGALLERTIRTGAFCSYVPDPETELDWRFSLETEPAPVPPIVPAAPSLTRNATLLRSLVRRTTFIGRTKEREKLSSLLQRAHDGSGGVAFINGQAGVGKSRIGAEIAEEALRNGFLVYNGACYDNEGSVPFGPFVEVLEDAMAHAQNADAFRAALGRDAGELARLVPQLRSFFPEIPTPLELPPEQARRVLFNSMAQTLARTAGNRPVLLLLDDLHWADEESLSLLGSLARLIKTLPVLIIGTYRDFELEPASPLSAAIDDLVRIRMVELIHLEGLTHSAVGEMLEALSGRRPPGKLIDLVHAETEGNPFFIEELFWYLSERGRLFDEAGNFRDLQIDEGEIPPTVRLVIGRRFARLGNDTRKALSVAAVIGRSFTFDLLAAAAQMEAAQLLDSLEEAERGGLIDSGVHYPDIRFGFTHELIRQVVISQLSPQRHRMYHLDIANAIARVFADSLETRAEEMAQHLWQAGTAADPGQTIRFLTLAAKRAREQGAYGVALRHLNNALGSYQRLPSDARLPRLELELTLGLCATLIATKGYAAGELEAPIARMLELCEKIDDPMLAFTVRVQSWANISVRGHHDPGALQLSERLLPIAEHPPNPSLGLWANTVHGISLFHTGQFLPARRHLERAVELCDSQMTASPDGFENPAVLALLYLAQALWFQGFPDAAMRRVGEGVALAKQVKDHHGLAHALCFTAVIRLLRREPHLAMEPCDQAIQLCEQHELTLWHAMARIWRGSARLYFDGLDEAMLDLMEGVRTYVAGGAYNGSTYWLLACAEANVRHGNLGAAASFINETFAFAQSHGERTLEAEAYRIRGALMLRAPRVDLAAAIAEFSQAINIARARGSGSLELRATTALAQCLGTHSRQSEAREILGKSLGSFTEGFDSGDLREGRQLLEELDASAARQAGEAR